MAIELLDSVLGDPGSPSASGSIDTTNADLLVAAGGWGDAGDLNGGDTGPGSAESDESGAMTALTQQLGEAETVDLMAQLFYNDAPSFTGDDEITVTFAGTSPVGQMAGAWFSGTGSFFQESAGGSTVGAGTTCQPGSITAPQNGCLFVTALAYDGSGGPPTINSGFTILQAGENIAIAYKIQTTAAAENPTWTSDEELGDAIGAAAVMAVFRPATGIEVNDTSTATETLSGAAVYATQTDASTFSDHASGGVPAEAQADTATVDEGQSFAPATLKADTAAGSEALAMAADVAKADTSTVVDEVGVQFGSVANDNSTVQTAESMSLAGLFTDEATASEDMEFDITLGYSVITTTPISTNQIQTTELPYGT